jgi:hypothetical protein
MAGQGQALNLADSLADLLTNYTGRHALDSAPQPYIPRKVLVTFWTDDKINQAFGELRGRRPPLLEPNTIRRKFIRLFSLLIYIGRLSHLRRFTQYRLVDENFPIRSYPSDWRDHPGLRQLYEQVEEHQWKFFPLIFDQVELYDQTLSPKHIIPINTEEEIRAGADATVYKIDVEPLALRFIHTNGTRDH